MTQDSSRDERSSASLGRAQRPTDVSKKGKYNENRMDRWLLIGGPVGHSVAYKVSFFWSVLCDFAELLLKLPKHFSLTGKSLARYTCTLSSRRACSEP